MARKRDGLVPIGEVFSGGNPQSRGLPTCSRKVGRAKSEAVRERDRACSMAKVKTA